MPNIAAGIGPAIQTFLQMRQFLDARHAADRADRGHANDVAQYMSGAPSPLGPMGPPQEPQGPAPGIAALGQSVAPSSMGGAPSPMGGGGAVHPLVAALSGMGSPMPGGAQGSPPSPLSAGGASPAGAQGQPGMQPPTAGPDIGGLLQKLTGPPPPPPRDESMSAVASPVPGGGMKDEASANLASMAKNILAASPKLSKLELYDAMQSHIEMVKGIKDETKTYMNMQLGTAKIQAQQQMLTQKLAERGIEVLENGEVKINVAKINADSREVVGAGHDTAKLEGDRILSEARKTVEGMRGGTARAVAEINAGAHRYSADHPRPASGSKYDLEAERSKTIRALINSGRDAATAKSEADEVYGPSQAGGGGGGGAKPAASDVADRKSVV